MRTHSVGPVPCDIALVSDYPGREEARTGMPLTGKTGQEVNRYLDTLGLRRDAIWIANLIREWRQDGNYPASDIARDGPELDAELARVKPSLIVTLGRASARHFLGGVDVDEVYGIPWLATGRDGLPDVPAIVFPNYNPAAGFRNPDLQAKVSYGFSQLGAYLAGKLQPRILHDDPWRGHERYVEITDPNEIQIDPTLPIYIDSEGYPRAPWSIQYTQQAGHACLLRGSRRDLVAAFGRQLRTVKPRIVYHNALHDLTVLRAMGGETADLAFDDTMVMAYLLQTEPQGLKPLCVRHCGMKMQSYDDILGDASERLARDYLISLYDIEQADYETKQHDELERINATPLIGRDGLPKHDRAGNVKYRRTRVLPKLAKASLHRATERVLRSKRPRKLWLDQIDDVQVAAYNRLGPMDEPTLDHVDGELARNYACRDADGTCRLAPELATRIDAMGLNSVYRLELDTYPLIDRMAAVGLKPDLAHFAALGLKLDDRIAALKGELATVTNNPNFNANSGDQVAALLFDDLGLPGSKRTTEGRFSTNDIILEGLEQEFSTRFPVISAIREYRETYKLRHTFVGRIPSFVAQWPFDERVHCTFRTTRVVTGRLASSDPNLLAQPKHGRDAHDFRAGWIEDDGWVLASWDQSQIELRILAHLSQDPVLLEAYRASCEHTQPCERDECVLRRDLHARLGHRIFGVLPSQQDESKHRLPSKSVNFGLPMGMTCFGLAAQLRKNGVMVDEDDAQRWIDETDALYVGIPAYKKARVEEARKNGFVRCMSGRIRYIGGIRSWDEFVRAEAERFAFSTPIQEGAQTVMKTAEAFVWNDVILPLNANQHQVDPLVQIHDDLLLRAREGMVQRLHPMMVWAMTQTYQGLTVPLATEGVWGWNWAKRKVAKDETITNERGLRKF